MKQPCKDKNSISSYAKQVTQGELYSSNTLLSALKNEEEALKEALNTFESMSEQSQILASEKATIEDTCDYLRRRHALISNMKELLKLSSIVMNNN